MNLIKDYEVGKSELTDAEYDAFFAEEGEELGSRGTIKHQRPLTSLKKVFIGEDKEPTYTASTVRLPKLDGLAMSVLYVKGIFKSAATRGDGEYGQDVTEKVRDSGLVPMLVAGCADLYQVDGELMCPASVPNARNVVAGALVHLNSVEEFKLRAKTLGFQFFAYRIGVGYGITFMDDMYNLNARGFRTVLDVPNIVEDWPLDGTVVRVDNNKVFYESGITGGCTNGGYALKVRKASVPTILKDVVWQTSPKGRVSPVGILEPVLIDGALVSRVTLHNIAFIKASGVKYGSRVGVIRAGEIIPRIMSSEGGDKEIDIPCDCPSCGSDLEFDDTYLVCVNDECPAKRAKLISHFFSALGVKGFGIKTSEKFDFSPAEIVKLPYETYCSIIGSTVGKKLFDQVSSLQSGVAQEDLLYAMCIPSVGKNTAKNLPPVAEWPQAITDSTLGEATKAKILLWYSTVFEDLWSGKWPLPIKQITKATITKATGIKVCVTGKVAGHTRDSLHSKLLQLGLEPVSTVSSKVGYLLCEQQSTSSSYTKAKSLEIPIVTLKELEEIFHD